MFNKLWLCHNINQFYRISGETIGVKPAHTKLRDLYEQIATLRETHKHNYKSLLTATTITLVLTVELISHSDNQVPTHNKYTAYGRYYTNGTVITNDDNEWAYSADTVSDQTPYDNMPIWVDFDDNGTPNDITDDIILGLVYDRETALSDKFKLERNDNNIRIKGVR